MSEKIDETRYAIPTRLIYGKASSSAWEYSHHVIPPITSSSTFRLDSAKRGALGFESIGKDTAERIYVYDRMGDPNTEMLEHALSVAEQGASAVVFSYGMSAVHAATGIFLSAGDHIVSHSMVYGCTYSLFTTWYKKFGVDCSFIDLKNPSTLKNSITDKTRIVYLESPVNPNLEMLDIETICGIVAECNKSRTKENRIYTVIDNTFATPFAQRPLSLGCDIVIHSLTKALSGFGTMVGGAVITKDPSLWEPLVLFRKDFGSNLAPQIAWTILQYGISTLTLRLPKQQDSAGKIAHFLEQHPLVEKVHYPGLPSFPYYQLAQRQLRDYHGNFAPGFMIYFTLKGSPELSKKRGEAMMDFIAKHAYTVTLAVSLGQLRTLIEHPGSMTHAAFPAADQVAKGIDPGGIRLAVGIEEPTDIIHDLNIALHAVEKIA